MTASKTSKNLIIIGLDGATWKLLKPFAESGLVPNIEKVMKKGCHGALESTIPPVTGPAWVSFATGKNPGAQGCFDFLLPHTSLDDLRPITTRDIKAKTFYEYLDDYGLKTISVNLPVSYPPRLKDNIFITSLMTQGDNCIFPSGLKSEIKELKEYRITPNQTLLAQNKMIEYLKDIKKLEEARFVCAQKLFTKEWNFFFILFSATDWIQHEMFKKLIKNEESREVKVAKEIYHLIDSYIGWFIENMPKKSNLLIVSDHGFKVSKGFFYLNEYLRRKGLLKLKKVKDKKVIASSKFMETLLDAEKTQFKEKKLVLPNYVARKLRFLKPIYKKAFDIFHIPVTSDISKLVPDLNKTSCLCTSPESNAVFLNTKERFKTGVVAANKKQKIIKNIIQELKSLKDSEGDSIFTNVFPKEEIYKGNILDKSPDILIKLNSYRISTGFTNGPLLVKGPSNMHDHEGIFLAYGKDTRQGMQIVGAKIIDIAPTALYLLGIPTLGEFDGRVLSEILLNKEKVRLTKIYKKRNKPVEKEGIKDKPEHLSKEEDKIKERLKDLGYL